MSQQRDNDPSFLLLYSKLKKKDGYNEKDEQLDSIDQRKQPCWSMLQDMAVRVAGTK
jgi:hypothetical protein